MNADLLKSEILELVQKSAPIRAQMVEAAARLLDLSIKYHHEFLAQKFGLVTDTLLLLTIPVQNVPSKTEAEIDVLIKKGCKITNVLFDMERNAFFVFGTV